MKQWLVTMGDFSSSEGILARVGWTGKRLELLWSRRYKLPVERRMYSKGFTGAEVLADGSIIVCGFNALYRVVPGDDTFTPWLARDDFNDLHDVEIVEHKGKRHIIVANTGLDRVDVFGWDGTKLKSWPLSPVRQGVQHVRSDPYFNELADLSRPLHLRKLRDRVHPNAVCSIHTKLWVSRFSDRAISLVFDESFVLPLPGCPHDLVLWNGQLWFTTTDGRVWTIQPSDPYDSLSCKLDSYKCSKRSGWVRGLAVSEDFLLLGFTRISRMPRERWTERPFDETATGLLIVNRKDDSAYDWLSLEDLGEHPKVFGIYPWKHS